VISKKPIAIFLLVIKLVLCLFFLIPTSGHSQALNKINIFPTANIYAHPNSNLSIFSDISHSGTFVSYETSLINFYSSIWQNNAGSRLPDESARGIDGIGGVFRFSDLLQLPQRINSLNSQQFNGFPNLRLDNSLNITADIGNLHVNSLLTIKYSGLPQSIKFRVADNLYNKLNFPEYVNKTWIMKTTVVDASATADLTLQHNSLEEGIEYFRNRDQAYVTRYDSNITGLWDVLPLVPTITPGSITQRAEVFNAYMNTRLNVAAIKQIEYFSKSVIKTPIDENTPVNIPDAISPNGDGFNDVYEVVKRLPTDIVRFAVYSRNQVLVFQDFDYNNTFNGTGNIGRFMGNNLPDGIYYYLISVNGAKGIPGYLIINR
jgi:gliding motility-associated-like protein